MAKRLKNYEAVKEAARVLHKLCERDGWYFSASLYREKGETLQVTQITNILPMRSREIGKKLITPGIEIEAKTFLADPDGEVHEYAVAGMADKIREDAGRVTGAIKDPEPQPKRLIEIEKPRKVYHPGEGWR